VVLSSSFSSLRSGPLRPRASARIFISFLIAFFSVSCYTEGMEPEIVFVPSAFKHGVTREDIIRAHETMIYDGPLGSDGDKYCFIGFNVAGNPIEVFYNYIDEEAIRVFHAMSYRNETIAQIEP
jgi:hypothetical protein